jgi:hypothetical protein
MSQMPSMLEQPGNYRSEQNDTQINDLLKNAGMTLLTKLSKLEEIRQTGNLSWKSHDQVKQFTADLELYSRVVHQFAVFEEELPQLKLTPGDKFLLVSMNTGCLTATACEVHTWGDNFFELGRGFAYKQTSYNQHNQKSMLGKLKQ